MSDKAIFLDRDGVINVERGYILNVNSFTFEDYFLSNCRTLTTLGYKLYIVTNQACINKGLTNSDVVDEIHNYMLEKIQMWGGRIDKIYCCPHADYENCECRKPNTKFLRDAKKEFNLNLKRSIVIGNSDTDTMLAKNAGCLSILYTKKSLVDFLTVPDYTARDWEQVIYIIKNNIKKIEEDLHVYN